MKPAIGRIVHLHIWDDVINKLICYPAIVTGVYSGEDSTRENEVDLVSFGQGVTVYHYVVPYSERPIDRYWSWPPRT